MRNCNIKKKIIIQFNEANFDIIKYYVESGYDLPFFKKIINEYSEIETYSEDEYIYLEPWIQWYSFYTNLKYEQHKVFNLGDALKNNDAIIFDKFPKKKIGAFASMNLPPRDYFYKYLPDPWTESEPINLSARDKLINYAIKQLINDNASFKLEFKSIAGLFLLLGIPKNLNDFKVLKKIFFGVFTKNRQILASSFDYLLSNYCSSQTIKNNLDISIFFLNGLAHIQHHYLYFSDYYNKDASSINFLNENKKYKEIKNDPILESLKIYDMIFQNIENNHKNSEVWIVTGLTQEKYCNPFYYWRFKNHSKVLNEVGIDFESIEPRMTRDFQITFSNKKNLEKAHDFLKKSRIQNSNDNVAAFGNIQKLGELKLFCSFIYDQEEINCNLIYGDVSIGLSNKINFVAIKNGGHISKGWAYSSKSGIGNIKKAIWDLSDLIFSQ